MDKLCSLITLTINSLDFLIKGQRLTDWIKKQDPHFFCIQETYLTIKDRYHLKGKRTEKGILSKWTEKQTGVPIIISDKMDFK